MSRYALPLATAVAAATEDVGRPCFDSANPWSRDLRPLEFWAVFAVVGMNSPTEGLLRNHLG